MRSWVISPRSRIGRAAGASSCGRQPSKGPAEIRGSGQSKTPGCLDTTGDANPRSNSDLHLARALLKGERRLIQRQAVMPLADSKRLTKPTRPRTELSHVIEPAPGPHHLKTRRRLNVPGSGLRCRSGHGHRRRSGTNGSRTSDRHTRAQPDQTLRHCGPSSHRSCARLGPHDHRPPSRRSRPRRRRPVSTRQ